MGAADSKLEDMMVHGGAGKFQARLAGKIHSAWQESRRLLPDGTRQPSWKTLRSSEPGVPSTTIDIANTKFFDLPDRWKLSNLNAARVIVSEILRHVKASTKGKIDSRSAKKLDLEFIEVAAHFTHQQWITEHQHSCDAAALIPYYLLDNSNKNFLRKLVRLGIDLYDPEEDRLDNTLFPPRDFVVVPLPSIEEDNVVSKGGKKRVMKPWESAFPGEEEDEEVVRWCGGLCVCRVCWLVATCSAFRRPTHRHAFPALVVAFFARSVANCLRATASWCSALSRARTARGGA